MYRYCREKLIDTLKAKVTRLVTPEVFESSKTLTRNLAKEGLMEDGKEDLLTGKYSCLCLTRCVSRNGANVPVIPPASRATKSGM